MYIKKITAAISAFVILCTALSVTAFAASVASPVEDFIISDDYFITGYTGNGGDIVIPEGFSGIDDLAFQENDNITSIVIPDGCTYVGACAFYDCTALSSVTFEGDMEAVGLLSFFGCTSLERVTFKGSVIGAKPEWIYCGLGANAFMCCENLKTVEFAPNTQVDVIGRAAFMDCAKLSDVRLPNEVGKICEFAFSNCPELTRLEIPSMTELEPYAAGYMYHEPADEAVKADGKTTVMADIILSDGGDVLEEVRQKPITLIVAPNSPAEAYAKENDIAYEYKNASDASEDGSTESPETGGTGMQTLLAAMVLSLTVMAIASKPFNKSRG